MVLASSSPRAPLYVGGYYPYRYGYFGYYGWHRGYWR